jgi:hypothetical protein
MYGFGDVTTVPLQGSAPPATVSPYAIVECGWGQKSVNNGPNAPNSCAFDPATAASQLWQVPGVYVALAAPQSLGLTPNGASAIGWGIIIAAGYLLFGKSGGRR